MHGVVSPALRASPFRPIELPHAPRDSLVPRLLFAIFLACAKNAVWGRNYPREAHDAHAYIRT